MATSLGWMPLFRAMRFDDSAANTQLNSATEKLGACFIAQKAGTIDRIGIRIHAISGTSPSYFVRLESVSSGEPSASLFSAGATASFDPNTLGTGWHWISLGTPATVAEGDNIAAVISYDTGTIDGSNAATFTYTLTGSPGDQMGHPSGRVDTTGSYVKSDEAPMIAARYDDGEVVYGAIPGYYEQHNSFNSSTTPDEIALKWTQPFTGKCGGAEICVIDHNTAADYDVVLYDSDGTTELASASVTADLATSTLIHQSVRVVWTPVSLEAGSSYRLSVRPTSTNTPGQVSWDFPDADSMAVGFGRDCSFSSRTDAGSWSDTSNKVLLATPLFTEMDVGAIVVEATTAMLINNPKAVGY